MQYAALIIKKEIGGKMFCKWCGSTVQPTDCVCDNCKRKTEPLSAHGGLKIHKDIPTEGIKKNKHDKRTEGKLRFLILINVILILLNACLLIGMEHRFSELSAAVALNMEKTNPTETVCAETEETNPEETEYTEISETVSAEVKDCEQPEKPDEANKAEDVTIIHIGS